ncbi:MAG: hypothetical protein COA79_06290 [Planctomycetota bacterium]|nr:MAG: hypothetical protein COA79_06290 [Planctomycetota bacterium]
MKRFQLIAFLILLLLVACNKNKSSKKKEVKKNKVIKTKSKTQSKTKHSNINNSMLASEQILISDQNLENFIPEKIDEREIEEVQYQFINPLPTYEFKNINNEEKMKGLLFPQSELMGQKELKGSLKDKKNVMASFIKRGNIDIPIIRITFSELINEKYPVVSTDGSKLAFEGWHSKDSGEASRQGIYYVNLNKNYKKNVLVKNKYLNLRPNFKTNSQEIYFISNSYLNRFHVNSMLLKGVGGTRVNLRVLCKDVLSIASSNKNDIAINYFKEGKNTASVGILESNGTFYPEVIDGYEPTWSYKGDKIVYVNNSGVYLDLYSCNSDGSDIVQLTTHFGLCHRPGFSPNDDWIVFSAFTETTQNYDLFIIRTDGRDLTQITSVKSGDRNPNWGSDGWIYFETDRFGSNIEIAKINPKVFIDRIEKKSTPAIFIK